VVAVLALFQLAVRLSAGWRALLLGLGSVIFLVGGGLALFHVGVEQHWWAGPAACSGGVGGAKSVEDLISALSRPINIPSCDQVAWSLFGVSMAGYNVLASLVLAGFSGLAAWRSQEPKR
jgi:disulfide bond formation protein DsbB